MAKANRFQEIVAGCAAGAKFIGSHAMAETVTSDKYVIQESFSQTGDKVALFLGGQFIFVSASTMESVAETAEILSDDKLMADIKLSSQQADAENTIPWDQLKKELGL